MTNLQKNSAEMSNLLVSRAGFVVLLLHVHAHGLPSQEYQRDTPTSPHCWVPKFHSGLSSSSTLAGVANRRSRLEVIRSNQMFGRSIAIAGLRGGCVFKHGTDHPKSAAADHFEKLLCTSRSSIVKAFNALDKDESGVITQPELRNALKTLGVNATEKEVKSIFRALDENSDGTINFEVATRSCPLITVSFLGA